MNALVKIARIVMYGYAPILPAFLLQNDQQAYRYCLEHDKTFIAIVWPIASGKQDLITHYMKRYAKILYTKEYYFTPKKAYALIKKAHANAHIADMKEHLAWYFPPGTYGKAARIFVLECHDMAHTLACKYAVRRLFPSLQYRSIHINDSHDETKKLARFFFT